MIKNVIQSELERLLEGFACYVEGVKTKVDFDSEWIIYVDVVVYFSVTEQQKTFSIWYSINGYTPAEIAAEIYDDIVKSFDIPEHHEKESERE